MSRTIDVVSISDPALDRKAMDMTKYAGTQREPASRDMALVKTLPGKTPVIFKCRALTRRQQDHADSLGVVGQKNAALVFGLAAVIIPGRDAMRPTEEVDAEGGGSIFLWSDEGLDALQEEVTRDRMLEIALVILNLSGGSGNAYGGNGGPRFWLPPASYLEAERNAPRSAA